MPNGTPHDWPKIVKEIGFPGVIALALLAAMLGWIPSPMLASQARLETHLTTFIRDNNANTYLLRLICQNLAQGQEEARRCLRDPALGSLP